MHDRSSRHLFSLYFAQTSDTAKQSGDTITLSDGDLVRRLTRVLHVTAGDTIMLFDQTHHGTFAVESVGKKEVRCRRLEIRENSILLPRMHWFMPLLDRDAFESTLSALTVLGATTVQPIITQKVHRSIFALHEHNRMHRTMIAAAEQSKQFMIPTIKKSVAFESITDILRDYSHAVRLFFDPAGLPAFDMIEKLRDQRPQNIICMAGPEGDLTDREKQVLRENGFDFYRLTPTILRSEHAIALAAGIIRSVV